MSDTKGKNYQEDDLAVNRLLIEYLKHNTLIIAFDFDDTIFDLHELNLDHTEVIELLQKAFNQGHVLCMWSTLVDKWSLAYKKEIAKNVLGFIPHYYNESPIANESRKPHFNILLDDRAGLGQAYDVLKEVIDRIESKSFDPIKVWMKENGYI